MKKYELSKYDFKVLDKVIAHACGERLRDKLSTVDIVTLERLKDRFAASESVEIKTNS